MDSVSHQERGRGLNLVASEHQQIHPSHPASLRPVRDPNCVRFNGLSEGLTKPSLIKEPSEVSKGEIEPRGGG